MINRQIVTDKALEYIKEDNQYSKYVITKVSKSDNGYEISSDIGFMFFDNPTIVPEVGMEIKYYGKGFGYAVRGVVINGVIIYYRTPEENEKDFRAYLEEEKKKKEQKFQDNKIELDKRFDKLPESLRKRIERFRANNPDFRKEYEDYELFCCEEAVKIANSLKTVDALEKWKNLNYEEQIKLVNIDSGHSGNTIQCSMALARHLLQDENKNSIPTVHGAMCPLVGCKTYGDMGGYEDEK